VKIEPLYACSQSLVNSLPVPRLVFDLGANEGGVAEHYGRLGSRVHAYEPVPVMFDRLSARVAPLPNVTPHRLGVSDVPGELKNVSVFNAWTLLPTASKRDRAIEFVGQDGFDCELTTIDIEASEHGIPDFIKIDVDGYELRVLKGAMETLSSSSPTILFEYSYLPTFLGDSIEEMADLIYGFGYRAWSMDGSYCARTAADFLTCYPEHTSYDVVLLKDG